MSEGKEDEAAPTADELTAGQRIASAGQAVSGALLRLLDAAAAIPLTPELIARIDGMARAELVEVAEASLGDVADWLTDDELRAHLRRTWRG